MSFALVCQKKFVINASCLAMLLHLSQNTSTRSLSPTSLVFRPSSPSPSCPISAHSGLEYGTLRDPRRSGGYTESASPTGYEPQITLSDDFEPRRIELDRNLGTVPYQIPERILGDDYRNPITEGTLRLGSLMSTCPTSSHRCIPIMTQRRALQTRILKMENYEKCCLHHCRDKIERIVRHLEYQLHRGNLLQ